MRKILLLIAVILLSQNVKAYDVFPDSSGNILNIRVSNTSSVFPVQQVKISRQALPGWITGLSPTEVNLGTLAPNQSATATFTFNIAANAPTGASEDIVLQVSAATEDVWDKKRVTLRVINPNGSISGKITNGSGATVQAVGSVTRRATANADGKYTITDLSPGTYTIIVSRAGYISTSTLTPIRVNTCAAVTGIDLTLTSSSGSISGRVNGSSGASIQVVGHNIRRDTTTNMSGEYAIIDLPPGTYTVTASQSGYASTPTSRPVRVVAGVVTDSDTDFTLTPLYGNISGKINVPGWWAYGVTVLAEGPGTKSITIDVFDALNRGYYTISDLLIGTYTVTASKPNYISTPTTSKPIVVTTGKTTDNVDFTLTYKYGVLSGNVDVEGIPTPSGAILTVTGPATKTDTLGETGWYTIEELPAGNYKVTVSKAGYIPVPASQTKTVEINKETKNVDFVLIKKSPQPPALNNPGDKTTVSTFTPTLKWNKSDGLGTIKYQLQVADNTLFQSPVINTEVGTNTEYVPTLSNGRTYYWRVCASNEVGTGSWSASWAFTIKVLPGKPVLSSPSNGSSVATLGQTFDWNDVPNATSYKIELDDNSDFSSPIIRESNLSSSQYSASNLSNNTTYYWRVCALNEVGTGSWSASLIFTIKVLPDKLILISPSNNSTIAILNPTFDWNDVPYATAYTIEIDDNSDFSSPIRGSNLSSSQYSASNLSTNTKYYWRVRASNVDGDGDWSDKGEFSILSPPETPKPSSPACYTTITDANSVTLAWNSVSNVSSYKVHIKKTDDSFEIREDTTSTSYKISNLSNGTYKWNVVASNSSGDSGFSDVWSFDINLKGDFWFVGNIPWPDSNAGISVELYKGETLLTAGTGLTNKDGDVNATVNYEFEPGSDYTVKAWKSGYKVSKIDGNKVDMDVGTVTVKIKAGETTKIRFEFIKKKAKAAITLSSPANIRNAPAYQLYAATLRKGAPPLGTITEAALPAVVPVLKTGETTVHLSTTRDVAEIPSLSYTVEGANHEPQGVALTGAGSNFEGKIYVESTTPEGTATFHYFILDETGSNTQIESGKEFVIDTTIYPEEGGESSNRDGSFARLPAGALKCPVNVRIIDAKSIPDLSGNLDKTAFLTVDRLTLTCLPRTERKFSAKIDGKEEEELPKALKTFTVCLPYLDMDDDGLVDNVGIPEEKLRIVYEDTNERWKIADEYAIDMAANRVTAQVTAFTKYMLASIVDITTMDKIISYPNPWHTDRGGLIKISYIPVNSQPVICIYNIAGELVRTLHEDREIVATDRGYMEANWDGKNDSGDSVASGIYLYLIKCNKGEKTGKMGVIR